MANLPDIDHNVELRESKTGTVERLKAIIHVLDAPTGFLKDQHIDEGYLGELLDELQDLVSSVDMSLAFHSEGGLMPLLNCLKTIDAGLRGKAANVVATLVWGNFPSQKLVIEGNGFNAIFEVFTSDPRVANRTNALGAIFSLFRNNRAAISLFRRADGYEALRDPLTSQDVCYQRKALDLIYLILEEDSGQRRIMHELGYPRMMAKLGNSGDARVRKSALWGLLKLARLIEGWNDNVKDDFYYAIKPLLKERIGHIGSLSGEELKESRTERVLVDTLWRTCFNEPSCLWNRGLLILPGEGAISSNLEREPFAPPVWRVDYEQVTKKQKINM